ncbi:ABC transporter permease [Salibacterium aidingense]|uniref:ABC transporter permease n=1 Tax=Salibacterium aidingense TaxID=384933 RepID=UPI003BD4D8D1
MIRKLLNNKMFLFSSITLLPVIAVALIGPLIAPHNPLELNPEKVLEKSLPAHPLGTDEYGRDILSRLIHGIRPTMLVAIGATSIALAGGVFFGIIAGYIKGFTEKIVMRVMDIVLCFPPILLALLVVGFWGAGVTNLVLIMGVLYIPYFARITHSATLQVKNQEFVQSELSLGASHFRVIRKSILPNITSPLIIQISLTFAATILLESGLSFLGLGVTPPEPSWGQMIGEARGYIYTNPLYVIWPSLCLGLTMLAVNLMGDSLRDVLDPKLKAK